MLFVGKGENNMNKSVKNKKLLSAIMIGISSMMFLQTPITAYANEPSTKQRIMVNIN